MPDALMLVSSARLAAGATQLRSTVGDEQAILRNGAKANAAQLDAAAALLREAEPSVITSAKGSGKATVTLNEPQEAPGFINADAQEQDGSLTFSVGVLTRATYRISLDGEAVKLAAWCDQCHETADLTNREGPWLCDRCAGSTAMEGPTGA